MTHPLAQYWVVQLQPLHLCSSHQKHRRCNARKRCAANGSAQALFHNTSQSPHCGGGTSQSETATAPAPPMHLLNVKKGTNTSMGQRWRSSLPTGRGQHHIILTADITPPSSHKTDSSTHPAHIAAMPQSACTNTDRSAQCSCCKPAH